MSTLAELEAAFWRSVRSESGAAEDDASALFRSDARAPATSRLAVYRRMYWQRQIQALAEVLPLLSRELGPRFAAAMHGYLERHPSEHPALERLARRLPEYLERHPLPHHPDALDLARLDVARLEALLAPDEMQAELAEVDPQRFPSQRLRLSRSLSLLTLPASLLARAGVTGASDLAEERCALAVHRLRLGRAERLLPADEAAALATALRGEPVSRICEAFAPAGDSATGRAFEVLLRWFQDAWIVTVHD